MNQMKNKKIKMTHGSVLLKRVCLFLAIISMLSMCRVEGFAKNGDRDNELDNISASKYEGMKLCVGGTAFGVKFFTKGVLVVGISSIKSQEKDVKPAHDAGIRVRDIIISLNGKEVNTVNEISEIIANSKGEGVKIILTRDGKKKEVTLYPKLDDREQTYKGGMWLRDSTAGIGTVTYINPQTGEFGGLGHGICDIDTGELMPLKRGTAMKVEIGGVVKGMEGKPGEIKGYFLPEKCGSVRSNTVCGVFGVFSELPRSLSEPIDICLRDELKEGKAEIICTLGNDGPKTYGIEISKIDRDGKDNKNFVVKVIDEKLIERTGGIVQGMSGSPIIQNGKLVGAITHVMVNNPAVGYGIFIENMLNAAA